MEVCGQQHDNPAPVGSPPQQHYRGRRRQRREGDQAGRWGGSEEQQSRAQRHAQRERRVLEQRAGRDVELQVRGWGGQGDGYCC